MDVSSSAAQLVKVRHLEGQEAEMFPNHKPLAVRGQLLNTYCQKSNPLLEEQNTRRILPFDLLTGYYNQKDGFY